MMVEAILRWGVSRRRCHKADGSPADRQLRQYSEGFNTQISLLHSRQARVQVMESSRSRFRDFLGSDNGQRQAIASELENKTLVANTVGRNSECTESRRNGAGPSRC